MFLSLFQCRHLATATESSNVTECAICVIGRSVLGQIVERPRGRPYGAEGVTNDNRTFAATSKLSGDNKNYKEI